MLHPDYQYDPRLVTAMAAMVASGVYDAVLGSRILGNTAIARRHAALQIRLEPRVDVPAKLALRGEALGIPQRLPRLSREVIERLPLLGNSDDFVFDNQMITQVIAFKFRIGEISCPTKYTPEASSISFRRSVTYGLGVRPDQREVPALENARHPNPPVRRPPDVAAPARLLSAQRTTDASS